MTTGWGVESPIEHRWDNFEKAPTIIQARFTDMEKFAMDGFDMAADAIKALSDIAKGLDLIKRTVPIDTTAIGTDALPDRDEPTFDPSLYNFRGNIDPPPEDWSQLQPVTFDGMPGMNEFPILEGPGTILTGDTTYLSAVMTKLQQKILNDLTYGSTGIAPHIEAEMQARNYERDLDIYNDEIDMIAANWSRGGCPYPNGGLRAAQDRAAREFSNKRQDVSRDIMIKSWDLAFQNTHFIVQQGIALEGLLIKWAENVATRVFEASKATVEANIRVFEARIKGFSEKIKAVLDKALALIQYNLGIIRLYEAKINAYAARMRAEADRITAVATGDKAEVDVFTALTEKDIKVIDVDLKVIQAKIEQAVNNAHILIKDKEIELLAYRELNALKEKAQEAVGSIAANIASGALSAVHAQVSIGSSNSADYYYNPNQVAAEE